MGFCIFKTIGGLGDDDKKDEAVNASDIAILPLENIDFTQSELLGKWIFLQKSLRQDLKILVDGIMTLEEWAVLLKSLCDAYLLAGHGDGEAEDAAALQDVFESFRKAASKLKDAKFSFITIKKHLEAALKRKSNAYREHHLQAVRFCSMQPMRAIPSKVIALIGMQEGAFPRIETDTSMNLLYDNPLGDYCPSQSDFDRYLFLEALISARSYFLLSCQGYSQTDGKPQPPSLLITEFLSYIEKAFHYKARMIKHPFNFFDARYFTEGSEWKSYSPSAYRAANAFYHVERRQPHRFIPQFVISHEAGALSPHDMTIKLDDLASFARDPVKVFFNKKLGIYLEKEEQRELKKEEDFLLSNLDRWSLTKDAFKYPSDQIIQYADKQGLFPPGMFKKMAVDKIQADVNEIQSNLAQLGLDPEKFFDIELSDRCISPEKNSKGHWQVPSLKIKLANGKNMNIIGTLTYLSAKGMVVNDKKEKMLRYFPLSLVLECISKKYAMGISSDLIFAKCKTSRCLQLANPEDLLQKYLEYYLKGQQDASPLIPDWIPIILDKAPEAFNKKLNENLDPNAKNKKFYYEYLLWMAREGQNLDARQIYETWKPVAAELFSSVIPLKSKEEEHEEL